MRSIVLWPQTLRWYLTAKQYYSMRSHHLFRVARSFPVAGLSVLHVWSWTRSLRRICPTWHLPFCISDTNIMRTSSNIPHRIVNTGHNRLFLGTSETFGIEICNRNLQLPWRTNSSSKRSIRIRSLLRLEFRYGDLPRSVWQQAIIANIISDQQKAQCILSDLK